MLRNEHHVIPRAFGGSDGPTVSLDTGHHDLLHLVAEKILIGAPWEDFVRNMNKTQKQRLLYLATRVVVAAKTMGADPNKKVGVPLSFSQTQLRMLNSLCKATSLGRGELLQMLLEREYIKFFQPRTKT